MEAEIERLTRNSAALLSVIAAEIAEVTRLIEHATVPLPRSSPLGVPRVSAIATGRLRANAGADSCERSESSVRVHQ